MARTIFFTGLPCSGKTTLAEFTSERIRRWGGEVIELDGDVLRGGLCSDLGFSDKDRMENLRRVAHLAKLLNENRITVVCSFIAPLRIQRDMIDAIVGNVFWIWTYCPPDVCEERDTKGMWAKARAGEIKGFTGIDGVYEAPERHIEGFVDVVDGSYEAPGCHLELNTSITSIVDCVDTIMEHL